MAMTELQQPSKADFYANIRNKASTFYNTMAALKAEAEFLNGMDADTLDNMTVPAAGSDEGLRTDLLQLRTVCNEMVAFFEGAATTQTYVPKDVINKVRNL